MELCNQGKNQKILIPAEKIGNNIDLLTQILLGIPAKPLMKFKCVSKQWLSLISNPQFCLSHTRHHHTPYPTPTALLLRNLYTSDHQFEIVPLKQHTIPKFPFFDYLINHPLGLLLRLIQSCNGLHLYTVPEYGEEYKYRKICLQFRKYERIYGYYICNPNANKFKRLSFPSLEFQVCLESVCIAFDPLKSNHYKLICIRTMEVKEKFQIDMYSSETDSWSLLGITFTPPKDMYFAGAVFCNGAVHWLSKDKTSLYFDVNRECLNTMPMPNLDWGVVEYFGESRGHLHLIVTRYPYGLQFDVLEMAADYSGWFVRYNVNLKAVTIALTEMIWNREDHYGFSVLHVIRAQKEEESIVVVFVDNKIFSCNVHNGISKKLLDLEHPAEDGYTWSSTFPYFEILTPV